MPIPVIDPTTSVLAYPQWSEWEYQPYATGAPTSWSSSPLPPGLTLNSATGKISGTGTTPGVYVVQLVATNADGPSVYDAAATPPVLGGRIYIGIEGGAYQPNSAINIDWDTQTGEITLLGSTAQATLPEVAGGRLASILRTKLDDDLLFLVRLKSQSTYLDVPLVSLGFALKEFEPETVVAVSTPGFVKVGTGSRTYYILHAHLDRTPLEPILDEYESDFGTLFGALGEFERVEQNLGYPDLTAGPANLRSTSRTFFVDVERDIILGGEG